MKLYLPLLLLALGTSAATVSLQSGRQVSASAQRVPILYTIAAQYQPLAWLQGHERFPLGAQVFLDDGKSAHPIVQGFAATADPSLSPDAEQILFSGRKTENDSWQIWEISTSGDSSPRQLTSGAVDHIRPFYLPDDRIVYARKDRERFVLEVRSLVGEGHSSATALLTFVPGSFLPSAVLQDGRILFSSPYPLGTGTQPEIYAVYPDGSGVEAYRCDHSGIPGRARYGAVQLSTGDIVFTHGQALGRFASAFAHEMALSLPAGDYAGDIAEIPEGWLVSTRTGAQQTFELKLWNSGEAKWIPYSLADPQQKGNVIQPVTIAPREAPRGFPSSLHDWQYANLLSLDASLSREKMPETKIRSVRVYTREADGKQKILGTAPVEEDGSFFISVPGDKPVRFELLDAVQKPIRAQHAWMWSRKGEQRICVGCHAGPEHAPENAVPQILNRSTTPANLTGRNQ